MLTTLVTLVAAAGVTSAAPLEGRQTAPLYPPTQLSKGLRFVANVTDPATDFATPVNNWVLSPIHVGAGQNDAVLQPYNPDNSVVFYINGTADDVNYGKGNTLMDGGSPPFPYGVSIAPENQTDSNGLNDISISVGSGTIGVQLTPADEPVSKLRAIPLGTYTACNEFVPYYNKNYTTVRFAYSTVDPETQLEVRHVPEDCIAIDLVPECATLNDLPAGSYSSHDYASTSTCYANVSSIDWSQYAA